MKKNILIVTIIYLGIIISVDFFNYVKYYEQKARYSVIKDSVSNSVYQITKSMNQFTNRLDSLKVLLHYKNKEKVVIYEKLAEADENNEADALIIIEENGKELNHFNIYEEYPEYALGATIKKFLPFSLFNKELISDIPKKFITLNGVKIYLNTLNRTENQNSNFDNISYIDFKTKNEVKIRIGKNGNIAVDLSDTNWTKEEKMKFEQNFHSNIKKYIP